jgi:hypothetical protein
MMGTVLLILNLSGNIPEVLRLKMCNINLLTSKTIPLMDLVLIPSKSVLDLEVKAWMVVTITADYMGPSSSDGGLGFGGIKS